MKNQKRSPKTSLPFSSCGRWLAIGALFAASGLIVQAQTAYIWTNTAGGSWTNSANWTNGIIATNSNNTADFSELTLTAAPAVTLDGAQTIGNLIFGDQGNSYGWTVNTGSGGPLTLAGTTPTITVNNQTTILGTVLAGTNGLTVAGAGALTLNASNTYSGPTVINGNLTLGADPANYGILSTNTPVTINSGATLSVTGSRPFWLANPGVALTVNDGGTLSISSAGNTTRMSLTTLNMTGGTVAATDNGTYGIAGSYWGLFAGGINVHPDSNGSTIAIGRLSAPLAGGTLTFNVDGGAQANVSGNIQNPQSGTTALTMTGAGTLTLSGVNTYTGATTLSGGTLVVSGSLGASPVNVTGGTLALSTNVSTGATLGTMTLGCSLNLSPGGTNSMRLSKTGGTPASDLITAATTVSYGGTLVVANVTSDGTPLALGDTFKLYTGSGGYAGGFNNFILPALPSGLTWEVSGLLGNGSISVVNHAPTPLLNPGTGIYFGSLAVTISDSDPNATIYYTTNGTAPTLSSPSGTSPITVLVPTNTTETIEAFATEAGFGSSPGGSATYQTLGLTTAVWTNLLGGSWTNSANWQGGIIATGVDAIANFSTLNITANRSVTNTGVLTIGYLLFGGGFNWTLTGGTNTLAVSTASPYIDINSGQNTTISTALAGTQGFTKAGAGTLTLNGANKFTGAINVNAGTLVAGSVGALGAAGNSLVWSNATVQMTSAVTYTNNLIFNGTSNNLSLSASPTEVGTISGGGTVVLTGSVLSQRGQMTNFNGILIVNAIGNNGLFMGQNDDSSTGTGSGFSGSSNAVFVFNGGNRFYLYNGAIPSTNFMGELDGNSSAVISGKYDRVGNDILQVGYLNTTSTFAGTIKDYDGPAGAYATLGITKCGTGMLTLSGANTYTGPTKVNAGTLNISGSLAATPVTVQNGGTCQLNGTVASGSIAVVGGGSLVVGAGGSSGSAAIADNGLMDVTAFGDYYYLNSGSLSGTGVVNGGMVLNGATLNPGPVGAAGTLTITNGDLAVNSGTLAFDLANATNGANDLLVVNGGLNLGSGTVNINQYLGSLQGGTYPLIQFTGAFSGSVANLTLTGAGPLDMLATNANGQEIDLVVNPAPTVIWTGGGAGNLWDIFTSTNWLMGTTPATFTNGDAVVFDNAGGSNPVVNIPATVLPEIVSVSGSSNYTFTGAADISGGCNLVKSGTGTLTILNANTFIGATVISGGAVQLGDGVTTDGSVAGNIANSASLVYACPVDQAYAGAISGSGTFTKQGAGNLTLTGNNAIGGPAVITAGTVTLGDGSSVPGSYGGGAVTNNSVLAINQPSAFTLTNVITGAGGIDNLGAGPVTFAGTLAGAVSLTNDVSAGTLNLNTSNTYSGGTFINNGTVFLNNFSGLGTGPVIMTGGTLSFLATAGTTNVVANSIQLPAAAAQQFYMPISATVSSPAIVRLTGVLSGGAAGQVTTFVDSGDGLINAVTLVLDNAANSFTTIPQVFRGTLVFTSDGALGNTNNAVSVDADQNGAQSAPAWSGKGLQFGASNITLNAARNIQLAGNENIDVQTFTGTIAGPVSGLGLNKLGAGTLILTGSGSLTGQTSIGNGTLQVDCPWAGSNFLAAAGTTLTGTGTITAPVTVASGATLIPGVSSVGTLTVSNTLSLAGTTVMGINAAGVTCSQVAGVSTLTYGGTLTVNNTGGTPAIGQNYQLFSAASFAGNFAATNLPALSTGIWQWNPANGTLAVVASVNTSPTNITATVSSGNLNLAWPANHTGWRLLVQTNNLAAGVSTNPNDWGTVAGSVATNQMSLPINPTQPGEYYRLVYP